MLGICSLKACLKSNKNCVDGQDTSPRELISSASPVVLTNEILSLQLKQFEEWVRETNEQSLTRCDLTY